MNSAGIAAVRSITVKDSERGAGEAPLSVWFVKCIIKREVSDFHSHYEKIAIFSSGISDTMCV